jgi:hypothetical protein
MLQINHLRTGIDPRRAASGRCALIGAGVEFFTRANAGFAGD